MEMESRAVEEIREKSNLLKGESHRVAAVSLVRSEIATAVRPICKEQRDAPALI